jgi:hypothetical protein
MNHAKIASDLYFRAAEAASRRVRARDAPVSRGFIRSSNANPPPLARCLRGGQGGEVRLKLLITLIWIGANPPHDTTFPARAWAELLDLPDPAGKGSRRIHDATKWLERARLIRVVKEPGLPSKIFLLDENGSGDEYNHPAKLRRSYVKLPPAVWTNGWMALLSGSALALLLIALDQLQGAVEGSPFWLSPSRSKELYGLSPDTWTRASKELRNLGILVVRRRPTRLHEFGLIRLRNEYQLDEARLQARPSNLRDL